MLCTRWDTNMFTSIKYIKSSRSVTRSVTVTDLLDFMYGGGGGDDDDDDDDDDDRLKGETCSLVQ